MIHRHTFQLFTVAISAFLLGCASTELTKTPTYLTDREIGSMIQGKWYEEEYYLRGDRARILQPTKLEFYLDGRVDYSFSSRMCANGVRTSHNLFWRVKDRNLIYSDTPAGEPSMTGGVITKISGRGFDLYTTKSTYCRYYRKPKRTRISLQ